MYFRPKIFISSVLSLKKVRGKIDAYFKAVGADVLLYEKNLTPSINRLTYRQDILDSDFVIFIIDEKYGSLTDSGISGTHEEYELIKNSNIPMHVYLKKSKDSKKSESITKLRTEISNDNISYYYYNNENELVKRIKETTFQIAKEIALSNIEKMNIPEKIIMHATAKIDYERGLEIIRDFNDITVFLDKYELDAIGCTLITDYFDIWCMLYEAEHWYFIDRKLDKAFENTLGQFSAYYDLSRTTMSSIGSRMEMATRSQKQINFTRLELNSVNHDYEKLNKVFRNFVKSFRTFEKDIHDLMARADIYS